MQSTLRLVPAPNSWIDQVQIVILDCPVSEWRDPTTREFFTQTVSLKLTGYGAEYPQGVISLDATDFFGTHVYVCDRDPQGRLQPMVAYKTVTAEKCKLYRALFPALYHLRTSGENDQVVQAVLDRCEKQGKSVSYDSSWTMRPDIRANRDAAKFLRDMITLLTVRYHQDARIPEWFTCGVLRFKTNQYFQWMGLEKITGVFGQYSLCGEKVEMFHLSRFSPEALAVAERPEYRKLWDDRMVIGDFGKVARPAAAAAKPKIKIAA